MSADAERRIVERWVDGFWDGTGSGSTRRVLPDGCIDFVFDLDRGSGWVVGPMTRAAVCAVPRGHRYFGVRFLPGRAAAWIDAKANELLDRDADFDELSVAGAAELAEALARARDFAQRRALVARFLQRAPARHRSVDPRVERATRLLAHAEETASIAALSAELGLGERQLERLFHEHVGLRPKLFARVLRLQRAVTLVRRPLKNQAELAALAGYADEPHLLREFRALSGVTPRALWAELDVGFLQDGVAGAS